jgi:chromosome segregation ATPase
MSRFWGSPREDGGDVESERDALRRQRLEAAEQLEQLKRELAQRVAGVQAKERELEEQLAQVGRVPAQPQAEAPPVAHDERAAELETLREQLEAREAAVSERELAVVTRESELEAQGAASSEAPAAAQPEPAQEPSPDELARMEAKLAELHEAEQQFARTHAELAARSDALAEREAAVALREQSVSSREPPPAPGLDELEARIRRLERSRSRTGTTQTFSSGLRALEQRGVRRGEPPNEPLH